MSWKVILVVIAIGLGAALGFAQPVPVPPVSNCPADLAATSEYAAMMRDRSDAAERAVAALRAELRSAREQLAKAAEPKK